MAEKVASLYAEITAKTDGLSSGLSSVKSGLAGAASSISSFIGAMGAITGVAMAVGGALKEAFELGQEGAQISQIDSSFNALLGTLGGAPSTLNQMREATRGTVDDLTLMTSANTLLIGSTGDLGQAFANALPELAGIAQAAHDVNPALGETSFLFDSLARGIKRASPLILDNLGLTIKLDDVYTDYAKTLGKTREELTAEEKSMAVLNAVLKEGTKLTAQAAQVNTQATDSFDKLGTAVQNQADDFKQALAPAASAAAEAMYQMVIGAKGISEDLGRAGTAALGASETYEQYKARTIAAAEAMGYFVNEAGDVVQVTSDMGYELESVVKSNYLLSESEWAAAKSAQGMANANDQLSGGLSTLDAKAAGYTESITNMAGGLSRLGMEILPATTQEIGATEAAWDAYSQRMTEAAEATGHTAMTMDDLANIQMAGLAAGLQGTLGDAIGQYTAGLAQLQLQQAQIQTQMDDLAARGIPETSAQYQQLTEAMNQNQLAQQGALASLQQLTAETIYNQAAVGLDTQAALDLARSMGVLSEADYATATAVQALRQEFDANSNGMIEASEGAARYAQSVDLVTRAVQSLQAKNMPVTLDNIQKEMQELSAADASGELQATSAAADEGAGTLEGFGEAASEAASGTDDIKSSAEDAGSALKAIQAAAQTAKGGLDTLKKGAQEAGPVLRQAANAAEDLGDAMRGIPRGVSISATATGFSEAIGWVENLTDALNNIPTSISASIHLSTGGGGGGGGGTGGGAPKGPEPAAPTASAAPMMAAPTTINVYNPLAMAMYMAQQKAATQAQFDEAMK